MNKFKKLIFNSIIIYSKNYISEVYLAKAMAIAVILGPSLIAIAISYR